MSTPADVCPFCLRFEGFESARGQGIRYCPVCGTDWGTLEAPLLETPAWRRGSVVLPLPGGVPSRVAPVQGATGPVPALGPPGLRTALATGTTPEPETFAPFDAPEELFGDDSVEFSPDSSAESSAELNPNSSRDRPQFHGALFPDEVPSASDSPTSRRPGDVMIFDAPQRTPAPGFQRSGTTVADRPLPTLGELAAQETEPVDRPPPPPGTSPWLLVVGAATALSLVVIGLFSVSETEAVPQGAPETEAQVAQVAQALDPEPPSLAVAPPSEPAALHPPLPTPRTSPERKSAAVKEHIERALEGKPDAVEAEVGVKVEDGVAYLEGTVDSAQTRELVSAAAGEAFGIRAVDARALKLERRAPPTHVVLPGETLSDLARRLYGKSGQWRRIYEVNPGIDPNLIRIGQALKLPASAPP